MSTVRSYQCLSKARQTIGNYAAQAVQSDDIESIRNWRNLQMDALRQKCPITQDEQFAYFETTIWPTMSEPKPLQILLSFFHENTLIGYGGLVHVDWDSFRAEVSFLLNPARVVDQTVYREDFLNFLELVKHVAFDDLGLHRIFVETFANRHHHISVLEEFGFGHEGTMVDHVQIDGRFFDSLIHGYLSPNVQ